MSTPMARALQRSMKRALKEGSSGPPGSAQSKDKQEESERKVPNEDPRLAYYRSLERTIEKAREEAPGAPQVQYGGVDFTSPAVRSGDITFRTDNSIDPSCAAVQDGSVELILAGGRVKKESAAVLDGRVRLLPPTRLERHRAYMSWMTRPPGLTDVYRAQGLIDDVDFSANDADCPPDCDYCDKDE